MSGAFVLTRNFKRSRAADIGPAPFEYEICVEVKMIINFRIKAARCRFHWFAGRLVIDGLRFVRRFGGHFDPRFIGERARWADAYHERRHAIRNRCGCGWVASVSRWYRRTGRFSGLQSAHPWTAELDADAFGGKYDQVGG